MKTTKEIADQAREMANALFAGPCARYTADAKALRTVSCIQREQDRKLSIAERNRGFERRPFWAFNADNMCRACKAYWQAEVLAQTLHEAVCTNSKLLAGEVEPTPPRTVVRPRPSEGPDLTSSEPGGGMFVPRVAVLYKDPEGLPRAYAIGPKAKLDEVRKVAQKQLETYRKKKAAVGDSYLAECAYTEDVVDPDAAENA